MWETSWEGDRRAYRRAPVGTAAVLWQKGSPVGRFVVQNLSAGGALLTGTRSLEPGSNARVLLDVPGHEPLALDGTVLRRAEGAFTGVVALAVAFRHRSDDTQDAIQDLVVESLMRGRSSSVLVVEDDPDLAAQLVRELGRLGRRVRLAMTPLDAVRWLEDGEEHIEAALVDLAVTSVDVPDLMGFLAAEYPQVRRVGLRRAMAQLELPLAAAPPQIPADVLLDDPWDPSGLQRAFN